ncbi:flippase, partial [Vibrio breoganii]
VSIYLIIILAIIPMFTAFNIIDLYYQSQMNYRHIIKGLLVSTFLIGATKLLLIYLGYDLKYFVYCYLFESFLLSLVYCYYFFFKSEFNYSDLKCNLITIKGLILKGLPLIISSVFIVIYMKIDQLMLMKYCGSSCVGLYSAATRLSEAWYVIPITITNALAPYLFSNTDSDDEFYKRLSNIFRLMWFMSISVAIITMFISSFAIDILFGENYSLSANILNIHIWAGIFVSLGLVQGKFWIAKGLQNKVLIVTSVSCATNVVLNILLIPEFGALGAAYATLISYGVGTLFVPLFIKEARTMALLLVGCLFGMRVKNAQ